MTDVSSEIANAASDEPETFGPYDERNPPPLDFEGWARIAASLLGVDHEHRDDHLVEQKVDPALFDACEAFWSLTIARQIQRGEMGLAKRYAAICTEAAERQLDDGPKRLAEPAPEEESSAADATGFLTSLPDEPALPFKPGDPAKPPTPLLGDEPDRRDATVVGGETAFISAVDVARLDTTLPFVAAAPMEIERYAELVVRTEGMPPGVRAAIHAEFGVHDDAQRSTLDADMARLLATQPQERAQYEAALARQREKKR